MVKGCLAKGYFQDEDKGLSCEGLLPRWGKGCEALARTQVYLSRTKLKLQVGI